MCTPDPANSQEEEELPQLEEKRMWNNGKDADAGSRVVLV
jgi:hypothetical protein